MHLTIHDLTTGDTHREEYPFIITPSFALAQLVMICGLTWGDNLPGLELAATINSVGMRRVGRSDGWEIGVIAVFEDTTQLYDVFIHNVRTPN